MQRILTIIVLLGALWPLSALAAFQIEPRLQLREEFTDNLFLDDRDEESDFITTINPGIVLSYQARLLELVVDFHTGPDHGCCEDRVAQGGAWAVDITQDGHLTIIAPVLGPAAPVGSSTAPAMASTATAANRQRRGGSQ